MKMGNVRRITPATRGLVLRNSSFVLKAICTLDALTGFDHMLTTSD